MGLRFPVLAALYVIGVLTAYDSSIGLFTDITGVLVCLGGLLVLCVIGLWPNASRADRVDRRVDGASWADRVDIEGIGRQRNGLDG
jgi:hypothetical protein